MALKFVKHDNPTPSVKIPEGFKPMNLAEHTKKIKAGAEQVGDTKTAQQMDEFLSGPGTLFVNGLELGKILGAKWSSILPTPVTITNPDLKLFGHSLKVGDKVAVDSDGEVFINDKSVGFVKLPAMDKAAGPDTTVVVKTDSTGAIVDTVTIPKVEVQPLSEVEAMTAEYVALYQKYEELEVKELTTRMDELKKKLASIANLEGEAAKKYVFKCPSGEVEFSPRANTCEVMSSHKGHLLQMMVKQFGEEAALSTLKFSITELKKVLSEMELAQYTEEKPGARTLKAVRPK